MEKISDMPLGVKSIILAKAKKTGESKIELINYYKKFNLRSSVVTILDKVESECLKKKN